MRFPIIKIIYKCRLYINIYILIVHLITSSSPTNLSLTVLETAAVFQLPGWFPALRAHLVLAPSLRDDTEEVLQTPTSRCRVRGDMAAVCLCAFMFKWPALACPNRPQHAESTRGGILDMAEHPHPLRWCYKHMTHLDSLDNPNDRLSFLMPPSGAHVILPAEMSLCLTGMSHLFWGEMSASHELLHHSEVATVWCRSMCCVTPMTFASDGH